MVTVFTLSVFIIFWCIVADLIRFRDIDAERAKNRLLALILALALIVAFPSGVYAITRYVNAPGGF